MKNQYEKEVRERWGDTAPYKESEQRTAGYTQSDWNELSSGMDAIMEGFAELKTEGFAPDDEPARLQVEKLKQFITERMYTCTDEILAGLGKMYACDERFRKNIDKYSEGTAEFVACAIAACTNIA